MFEDYDELDELDEAKRTGELEPAELPERGEKTVESQEEKEEREETDERGKTQAGVLGGACDESFWKSRAQEYYADGNMSKYRECMEKAAAAAIS